MAYVAWKDKLQHRYFIGERGFNKWISLFQKLAKSKGWPMFYHHKAHGFVDLVNDFYANMVRMKDKVIYVIEKWISFGRE